MDRTTPAQAESGRRHMALKPTLVPVGYLKLLYSRRRIWTTAALAGALLGWALTTLSPQRYQAHASLEIVGLSGGQLALAGTATRLRVLGSQSLMETAVEQILNTPGGPRDPAWESAVRNATEGIMVSASDDGRIIDISCEASTPRAASGLANALALVFAARDRCDRLDEARQTDERINRQLAALAASDAPNRDALLELISDVGLNAVHPAGSVRILDPAEMPRAAVGLSGHGGAVLGLLLGLCSGCLFVVIRDHLDPTFKRPGDASRTLGLRELGAVPAAAFEQGRECMTPAGVAVAPPPPAERTCAESRPSWLAECVRGVRTSLIAGADHPQVLTVTSPTSREGKTTIAANLAASFAESGRRTLLVDANLRQPKLYEVFGISNSEGLADLLQNPRRSPAGLCREVAKSLWLLPAGVALHGGPGLLHEPSAFNLLASLRQEFDVIVLDSPATLGVSDARTLAAMADGTVLVVRAGVTDPADAIEAKSVLESDGIHLLGVVLNSWNPRVYGGQWAQNHEGLNRWREVA